MLAARLYGPKDLRIDDVPEPPAPAADEVTIQVTSIGVCGSDLHTYLDGRIGSTAVQSPLVLGHEFAGIVTAVGKAASSGLHDALHIGQRVAVDPATPCWRCEMCETGHPNLCHRLHFCGLFPDDGALRQYMNVHARTCFPLPDTLSNDGGALLEPLGIALHAVDLGKLKVARSVAVIGCGPIGLLITRLARLSGAAPIYAFDCFTWRAEKALQWGADEAYTVGETLDAVETLRQRTNGRGTDVVFEAAWADHSIAQAAEMARMGGRVVLVGIPSDDSLTLRHSTARRKGLTLVMSRRMKHTYPRALKIAETVPLDDLVSHRFALRQTPDAYRLNIAYEAGVQKVMIDALK
jgi:L-iditol 2-dehydrogenase